VTPSNSSSHLMFFYQPIKMHLIVHYVRESIG